MTNKSVGSGLFYRAVWRWHFLAGIVTIPFALFMAVTGGLYVWRPQYEAWRYHDLLHASAANLGAAVSADAQFAAARARHPEASLVSYSPPAAPGRSSETILGLRNGETVSVFVDPVSGRVLGERRESERIMMKIHDLHGTLLVGRAGQWVVELAATWMFVLVLTGLYLAWPRPRFSAWGFLLPRFRSGPRLFWRDLHAVTAAWACLGLLGLLGTGMLWTQAGGGWYRIISAALGQGTPRALANPQQSALVGWSPPLRAGLAQTVDGLNSQPAPVAAAGQHPHGRQGGAAGLSPGAIPLARVVALSQQRGMPADYTILFPIGPRGIFSVVSNRDSPFNRTTLHLDQYSGKVLAEVRYRDYGLLGKFGLWAIIAHEGHLFGLLNQIVSTLAALAVILIAFAGFMLWRGRAEAPAAGVEVRTLPMGIKAGLGVLAVLLPLLAASLAVLLAVDWLVLHRVLGRRPAVS